MLLTRVSGTFRKFTSQLALLVYIGMAICFLLSVSAEGQLPYMNAGPHSAFAQIDFSRLYSSEQAWDSADKHQLGMLVDSGIVSAVDLMAPDKAVDQFKQATSALQAQNIKEAIRCLQKAVQFYPNFVSAHNALGLVYLDQGDARAKQELETAARLDDKFPGPMLNLGMLAIAQNDFATADADLEKAASQSPSDVQVLTALAFAQNGNGRYSESLKTTRRVHALKHHGLANVHYIAASAALALQDLRTVQSELGTFLSEDPSNPLSPIARKTVDWLAGRNKPAPQTAVSRGIQLEATASSFHARIFANSPRLRAQVNDLSNEPESDDCENCDTPVELSSRVFENGKEPDPPPLALPSAGSNLYTIRQAVDETALFFAVSHHGHTVDDLSASDIQIRDENRPPEKILEFLPQSKLPLRLGLLIDVSNSINQRFEFEKRAAQKFMETVLNGQSDLAFVAGFNNDLLVTQDFTHDPAALDQGIDLLSNGGETALFDAVYLACWKLGAHPESGRVAKVLVVLTDGEDNASRRSLRQAVEEAEADGITIYTINTADKNPKETQTDANKLLELLAKRTGGDSIFPGSLRSIEHYLGTVQQAIRNRYLVAYKPAEFAPDGKYRLIHVRAEKDGKRLQVHARKGYYARMAPPAE